MKHRIDLNINDERANVKNLFRQSALILREEPWDCPYSVVYKSVIRGREGAEMEQTDCVYDEKQYPNGREVCVEDQCIRCDSGEWVTSESDLGYGY